MIIKQHSTQELFNRLRQVKLRGHGQPWIYRDAHLAMIRIKPYAVVPSQNYVLRGQLDYIRNIVDLYSRGVGELPDPFSLDGFIEIDGIPFIPPIIEVSQSRSGRQVLLVNDGMHRLYAAVEHMAEVTCVLASSLDPQYPYYAWPLENSWNDVKVMDRQPDVKKDYREEDYKALFRDFNPQFPGYQPPRDKYK